LEGGKLYEPFLFERTGGVAKIALNRPKKLDAFDATMHDELYAARWTKPQKTTKSAASCYAASAGVSRPAPIWPRSSRTRTENPTSGSTCAAPTPGS
jgi:hypothetical protein